MSDNTYNTDIARKQGGDAYLFFGEEVSASFMRALVYGKSQVTRIGNSATVLSTINVPLYDGLVVYSLASVAPNASAYLQGATKGQEKTIIFQGLANSIGSVFFSLATGVTLLGPNGELSSINAHHSSNSSPYIKLIATDEDTWAVVDTAGQVTLNLIA